ncbi:MAG: hypothetical protein ACKVWV_03300 [Planctomycetota bacterium]
MSSPVRVALALATISTAALPLSAQCIEWTTSAELPGTDSINDRIYALETYDPGTGAVLAAGGSFHSLGGVPADAVAAWNGSTWSAIDVGFPPGAAPTAVAQALFASGSDLYVGGSAQLNASTQHEGLVARAGSTPALLGTFTVLGSSVNAAIYAFAFDGSLYAAGRFNLVDGIPAGYVARYTGAGWEQLGTGLGVGSDPGYPFYGVRALAFFDDGNGEHLYAAGFFFNAGGMTVEGIARWNGSQWSGVGDTLGLRDFAALAVFDDGTGAALYAAGGSNITNQYSVARFDGTSWSFIANPAFRVQSLCVFDDGGGAALYAAGTFTSLGSVAANRVAKWNGSVWSTLGAGITSSPPTPGVPAQVSALEGFDDGSGFGPALYVGGQFTHAGSDVASSIAAWKHCSPAGTPFCFGDGSLATPCPCAPPLTVPNPSGAPGHGCANSFEPSGARLFASGTTNPDTLRLHTVLQTPSAFSMFFSGTASVASGSAVGDGVRCADGALVRFGRQNAAGGAILYPLALLGLTQPVSSVSGVTPGSGVTRFYQAIYRDTSATFCNPGRFNLTNALEIVWN